MRVGKIWLSEMSTGKLAGLVVSFFIYTRPSLGSDCATRVKSELIKNNNERIIKY